MAVKLDNIPAISVFSTRIFRCSFVTADRKRGVSDVWTICHIPEGDRPAF